MLSGPDIIVSAFIGQDRLFQSVLQQRVFGFASPGTRKLMFVKTAKFHEWMTYAAFKVTIVTERSNRN